MAKHKLNAQKLAAAPAGKYCDGANLWAHKDSVEVGRWVYRYQLHGESHAIGLGSMSVFSLKEARAKADRLLKMQKSGIDPLAAKQADIVQKKIEKAKSLTFAQCAVECIKNNRAKWRSAPHEQQWENSLKRWVYPAIGDLPIQSINKALVLKVLEQPVGDQRLWEARAVTAERIRDRIGAVLTWAASRDLRPAEDITSREILDLPHLTKARNVKHFAALAYDKLPDLVTVLRQQTDVASKALMYGILVAARPGEVQGLRWEYVSFDSKLIVIPGPYMKSGHREHRIPLSTQAFAILNEMRGVDDALVFPGLDDHSLGRVLKRLGYGHVTAHGTARSSFRDWAAEETDFPKDAIELQLAHRVGNATELAYRRGDLLKKRYDLVEAWAEFCSGSSSIGNVLPFALTG